MVADFHTDSHYLVQQEHLVKVRSLTSSHFSDECVCDFLLLLLIEFELFYFLQLGVVSVYMVLLNQEFYQDVHFLLIWDYQVYTF